MFWTNCGSFDYRYPRTAIMSANKDGGDVRTIAALTSDTGCGLLNLALDDEFVYWVESRPDGRVMRARKEGGEAVVIASGQKVPRGLAVDACSVYWTNVGVGGATGSVWAAPKASTARTP